MDDAAARTLLMRVSLHLRYHPGAAVIVVGRLDESRAALHALAAHGAALASAAFKEDLAAAMREGIVLYDAAALASAGPGIAERAALILVEGQDVRVVERA